MIVVWNVWCVSDSYMIYIDMYIYIYYLICIFLFRCLLCVVKINNNILDILYWKWMFCVFVIEVCLKDR